MFGVILTALSAVFREIGTSIGKREVLLKKESVHTMAFLNLFWASVFFFAYAFFIRGEFIFQAASLPTFLIRAVLEVLQMHFTMRAIVIADRSTFGFIRIWTIPILLLVDIVLGYTMNLTQIAGIGLIVVSFVVLFMNHGIRKQGADFVTFTALNAVVTISLYKYNVTFFNSVEAEQGLMTLILIVYAYITARFIFKERPLALLKQPVFLFQSLAMGIADVLMSFAYLFAAASVITSAKRSLTILTSILSGNLYFNEKKLFIKITAFILIMVGVILLALP